MTDEKFVFTSDVKEKKIIARSSHKRRTHNGRGGAVRFPSDFMTRKEMNAMNGEVKTYRLKEPMKWGEFKAMPDPLKVEYIKGLRERFGVPDLYIGKMFGVSGKTICLYLRDLKCSAGAGRNHPNWDKEGFLAWCNGEILPACSDESVGQSFVENVEKVVDNLEDIPEPVELPEPPTRAGGVFNAVPCSGNLSFIGAAETALNTVAVLLGGANVRISIAWEVCPEGACEDG